MRNVAFVLRVTVATLIPARGVEAALSARTQRLRYWLEWRRR
jgi:hypothetical protein